MDNTQNSIVYAVNSDLDDGILYAEFETEDAAIEYAKRNLDKLPFVDELQVSRDANGEIDDVFEYKTVWDHTMADSAEEETEDDYWDELETMYDDSEKHVIGDTTWFEDLDTSDTSVEKPDEVKYLRQAQTKTPQASDAGNTLSKKALKKADLKNTDDLVETLEENEDEVECKECFDLFPKVDCIKVDLGYICPTCAEGGTVSENDVFKIDFPEYEKMSFGNDMIPDEPMIPAEPNEEVPPVEDEIDPISTPEEAIPFLVNDEEEAIAGYEKAAEVVEDSDLENKEEILDTIDHIKEEEEEHIEELTDLVDTKEDTDSAASDDEIIDVENDPVSEEPEAEELEEAFSSSPMTKDDLYDRLVNKGESVDLDVGDQGYSPEDTGSFSDGGYYGGSVIYIEFDNGKFGATEFYRSESGDEKEGYWDFETESFDELWDEIMNTSKPEDLVEQVNEEHPEVAADVEEGIELTDVR
jgi:rubrerythrin